MEKRQNKNKNKSVKINILMFALVFCLLSIPVSEVKSQIATNAIDFAKVSQAKLRKMMQSLYLKGIKTFCELNPSCYLEADSSDYSVHRSSNLIKEDINEVWKNIKTINPKEIYTGRMLSFGFIYSKKEDKIVYCTDEFNGIEVGQIIFINLRMAGGLKNLGVGLELTNIDEENKTIRYCYLQSGISHGTQEICLEKTEDGYTRITQTTHYKSKSKLLAKYNY